MADRWFIVPPITSPDENSRLPKYSTESGITAFSGTIYDFSDAKWSDLPWYPDEMYVVRFYASRNKELNDLEKYGDTWSERDVSDQDIADYLNDRLGASRSYADWESRFFSGGSA